MDYKYINQLLERYFECETTLQEEEILRTFFSQEDVPVSLLQYRDLFVYEHTARKQDTLGEDFDQRMLKLVGETPVVKAKRIAMSQRLMPLFRAAAVIAIVLTLGNAMQMPFNQAEYDGVPMGSSDGRPTGSMARTDSASIDTLQRSSITPEATPLDNSNIR